MPKINYTPARTLNEASMAIVKQANEIIAEYQASGFTLTLRQLYYQFVSRDEFPASWADKETGSTNNERSYKRLGDIISDARMCGLMDWEAIIDRTRALKSLTHWQSPANIVQACASQFRVDMWASQAHRVEVWVEKDAAIGVVEGVCNDLRVPYFSCRGYTSQSAMWEAAQRLIGYRRNGQTPVVLHFGDHDPSGIDMSRDIEERIAQFMQYHDQDPMEFERLALNMDQVQRYNPPPNPTKVTDSRAKGYIAEHGHECWELDALEPAVVADLIRRHVAKYIDGAEWANDVNREIDCRRQLGAVADKWESIVNKL